MNDNTQIKPVFNLKTCTIENKHHDLKVDIREVLVNSIYHTAFIRNNCFATAEQLKNFKEDATTYYLNNPRFGALIDAQTMAIVQIIEKCCGK